MMKGDDAKCNSILPLIHAEQRGFTLLELLFTLAIAGIISGLAISSFSNFLQTAYSNRVANQLISLVHYARGTAVSTNHVVALCGSSDGIVCNKNWGAHILVFIDYDGDGVLHEKDHLLKVTVTGLSSGDAIFWRSFRNKPYLQLWPDGTTYFQNGNFTYCPKNQPLRHARHLVLNRSGFLRVARDLEADGIANGVDGKNISCDGDT